MSIKDTSVYKRLRQFMNPSIKGKYTEGILAGLAAGDKIISDNILFMKENLFIMTATGPYLKKLLSGIGITAPIGLGMDDNSLRDLAIKQTNSKVVTNALLDVLESFYGADAVKATAISGKPEGYKIEDGMNLLIQCDNQEKPLNVNFIASDFENIAHASAQEVCSVISRYAFNAAYPIIALVEKNRSDDQNYIKIQSLTKGSTSSIKILGGTSQVVFQFDTPSKAQSKLDTIYDVSFTGQTVRFTWYDGSDPGLQFLKPGDTVIINGNDIPENNRGTFEIVNCQGGTTGQAYFEIINPYYNYDNTSYVNCVPADAVSGNGIVTASFDIDPSPVGAVRSSGSVTITTSIPHSFAAGDVVTLEGIDNSTFWGEFKIISVTLNTFTFNQTGVDATSGGGKAKITYQVADEPAGAVRQAGESLLTIGTHSLYVGQQITVSNMRDSSFDGTYIIADIGIDYIGYIQDYSNTVYFFSPKENTLESLQRYATIYETNPYEITVFLPVTTQVIRSGIIGSWYTHSNSNNRDYLGSYIYSPKSDLSISKTGTKISEEVEQGKIKTVLFVEDSSDFADAEGYLMFDWGHATQEGPVKYISRPSDNSLILDATYKFKYKHEIGSTIHVLADTQPLQPATDGSDYQAYLTGTSLGRIEAINTVEKLKASGIFLNIVLVTPSGPGLHSMRYIYDIADTDVILGE